MADVCATDQRQSRRILDFRTVGWRVVGETEEYLGWLVQWSGSGIALLTERPDTPSPGCRIEPHGRTCRMWKRQARVVRTESLSGLLCLAAAEYCADEPVSPPEPAAPGPLGVSPDRRHSRRNQIDRRRSARWRLRKALTWRVHRGRQIHRGQIIARSLDGLVVCVPKKEAPSTETRIHSCGEDAVFRFGFKSAIVRRIEPANDGKALLIAEVES